MADLLSLIKAPVEKELNEFISIFNDSLTVENSLLNAALEHIRQRGGKRMRPILTLLMTKVMYDLKYGKFMKDLISLKDEIKGKGGSNSGGVNEKILHAACSVELLHTASLVHDDVVDESEERRGQASVNASFNNKVAVLVGDYILSTSLREVAKTGSTKMVDVIAKLGQTLSNGELTQLENIGNKEFSEGIYYSIISKKTASLFETCCYLSALATDADEEDVIDACHFGHNIGMMFQIRDDIFDYYDSKEIGKPTGNDMHEGKLTLPVLYALVTSNDPGMRAIAIKVKGLYASDEEIAQLVAFTKASGGIEYAQRKMDEFHEKCMTFIDKKVSNPDLKTALTAYVDFVMGRKL